MSPKDHFLAVLSLPTAERASYLAGLADEVRPRVEELLAAHLASGLLAAAPPATTDYAGVLPGVVIAGRYTLEQKLGEGGMGEVWVARQTEPVKRRVALKLIKSGMDSKAVLQRFEQERQALAMMDHPNIARLIDGGVVQEAHGLQPLGVEGTSQPRGMGRPYFVMELVNGVPLTKFCDEAKLTPRQRLELFVPICHAVQHAHQKGILHRDLKPSNILVTLYDGQPVAKIIDFGVAKALGGKLTDETLSTQFGAVVGTLEYMAPEQARLSALDVDTRADLYSLGVILYELLTGLRPFDSVRLRKAAFDEVLRILRDEEPPKPSTRLSSDASAPSLAALRRTELGKLSSLMRGELDWVVMKCLEKDRNRRYETANGLARDLQRYLAEEPVEARPPSAGYRFSKFLKRHRVPVLAAGLVFLALIVGLAGTIWGLVRAERAAEQERQAKQREADRADGEQRAKEEAQAQRKLADANAILARREQQVSQAVRDFLQQKLLMQADPRVQADFLISSGDKSKVADKNITIRQLLDRAAAEVSPERLEDSFPGQPLVQAEILGTIGRTYYGVGEAKLAVDHLRRAVALRQKHQGEKHEQTLADLNELGLSHREAGNAKEELRVLRQVYETRLQIHPPDDPAVTVSRVNLAGTYYDLGNGLEALSLLTEALEHQRKRLPEDDPEVLTTQTNLAAVCLQLGQHEKAVKLFERVHEMRGARMGYNHAATLAVEANLIAAYESAGQAQKAIERGEKVAAALEKLHGRDHPKTLNLLITLADNYKQIEKLADAERILDRVIPAAEKHLGPHHDITLIAMAQQADLLRQRNRVPEAIGKYEKLRPLFEAHLGPDSPHTLTLLCNLGTALWAAKRLDQSIPLFEEVVRRDERKFGRDHPNTLQNLANLGVNYRDAGRVKEALPLLEEAYSKGRAFPSLEWVGYEYMATCYAGGKDQWPVAVRVIKELVPVYRRRHGADLPVFLHFLTEFGLRLIRLKHPAEAEPLLREALASTETLAKAGQAPAWHVADCQCLLGGALLKQGKHSEAGPLLQAGYAGLKKVEKQLLPDNRRSYFDALTWLKEFAEANNQPDQAAKWQKELDALPPVPKSSKPGGNPAGTPPPAVRLQHLLPLPL